VVRLLLDHGFILHTQDANGNTPLHLAARNGNLSTVKLLIARGTRLTLVNRDGQTPLTLAYRYHRPDIVALLEREADIAVFGRLSRAGRAGGFTWQPTPTGEFLPPDAARQIAQYALAPGYIPPTGSPS
jgi:ankyrin repeat protein